MARSRRVCFSGLSYYDLFDKRGKKSSIKTELLEATPGNKKNTYASVIISLQGEKLTDFINLWQGTICWICESPYRSNHKRKNWFIGVNVVSPIKDGVKLNEKDLKFETMRASGAGGQHVNTTDSAVRITHIPTATTLVVRDERSQHMNKKLALHRLVSLLEKRNQQIKTCKVEEKWKKHNQLGRGNPIRIFVGAEFKEKR